MSGTPLARPSAWRLWWSFTWRQALAYSVAASAMWALLFSLKWAGVPPGPLLYAHPWLTLVAIVFAGYEASRRLLAVYDIHIRKPEEHHDEQNHRHRR